MQKENLVENNIHYIGKIKDGHYFFIPKNYEIVKTTEQLYNIITKNRKEISDKESESLKKFYSTVMYEPKKKRTNEKRLAKLTLVVANDCNLSCKYCYVDGGSYDPNIKNKHLSQENAKDIVDYLVRTYDVVERIAFFGGEPLLNFKAIETTVKYINELVFQGKLKEAPIFSITTNGTIYSKKIFQFLAENKFSVCISIDGDEIVHDMLRPYKNGKGSFSRIKEIVELLQSEYPDLVLVYSTTYTSVHLNRNQRISNIRKYIKEELNLEHGTIIPVMVSEQDINKLGLSNEETYDLLSEDVEFIWNTYEKGAPVLNTETMDFLVQFMNKGYSDTICAMGDSLITINSEGDIYPCQTLLNNQEMIIGNIYNDETKNKKLYDEYYKVTKGIRKTENEECLNCIAINFCTGCPARWYYERKDLAPWNLFCKSVKQQTQDILLRIIEIRSEPDKWKLFTSSMKKLNNTVYELQN